MADEKEKPAEEPAIVQPAVKVDMSKIQSWSEDTGGVMPMKPDESPIFEQAIPGDGFQVTYRHRTIRNWQVAQFQFREHLMTLFSEEENNAFIDLLRTLPMSESFPIVKYNPEYLSRLESPVDLASPSGVARGTLVSTDVKDAKTNAANPSTASNLLGSLNKS